MGVALCDLVHMVGSKKKKSTLNDRIKLKIHVK
jgi:hypothetical protein